MKQLIYKTYSMPFHRVNEFFNQCTMYSDDFSSYVVKHISVNANEKTIIVIEFINFSTFGLKEIQKNFGLS